MTWYIVKSGTNNSKLGEFSRQGLPSVMNSEVKRQTHLFRLPDYYLPLVNELFFIWNFFEIYLNVNYTA